MSRFVKGVVVLGAAFNLVFGAWAFFAPASFFDTLATFPPYSEHFVHDTGAFQIGVGATLVAALLWSDALLVVLAGFGAGTIFHLASHVMDGDLGGRSLVLGLLAAVAAAASAARARTVRSGGS